MTIASTAVYHLSLEGFPPDHFQVHSFEGQETISDLYSFEVVVTCEAGGDEVERVALGQRARLWWNLGDKQRAFHGIIAAVRLAQVHRASHAIKYRLRLVPRLWLLKRKRRTRIFQGMRVPDIVTSVLAEAGIATRWQLVRDYPLREYCTQYEETDYRFVTRLLAECGIFFYFAEGPPLDDATAARDTALGAVASFGSSAADALGGAALGSLVGAAAGLAGSLIPGDTVICADDAICYAPIGRDDPAALAASTAAALAASVGGLVSGGDATVGAVVSAASAVAGTVIADVAEAAADVPELSFLDSPETTIEKHDKIWLFEIRTTTRSNAATFRDYDPDRPMVRLESTATSTMPFGPSVLQVAGAVTGAIEGVAAAAGIPGVAAAASVADAAIGAVAGALGADGSAKLEVYEHHSPFLFPKWSFANDEAPRILRQKRRRTVIARGESGCSDLSPARRFALRRHPAAHLDRAYVVTSVTHHGRTRPEPGTDNRVYASDFECAPAEMTYTPRRPKRESVQVSLTATVVGPANEEIYVDAMGQIKVQFHWDREGRYDERSSCWIRTMQPWAGAGWGHQFIPRIGMEVVVVFEGGDPDKPMVLGSLYNGTHPPPFLLPGDKTRSGWRTQSSPGGGGFNELSFEDAAGKEQIYVHAQRNLNEVVERNHTLLVKYDEFIKVVGNRLDAIEKNLEEHVKGDHTSAVEGNRIDVVKGNSDERVSGMRVTRVEGRERLAVQGATDLSYADDVTTRAAGCMTTIVGKSDKKRSWVTHAEGTAVLSGLDKLELRSDKELVLGVGKSSIRITADKIEIAAAGLSAKGGGAGLSASDDGLALSSKGDAQMVVGKKLVLKTDGASLAMDKEVKVDGAQILLNSPEQAKDPKPKDPDPPTKIALTDQEDGSSLPYQRFLAKLDDGSEVSGMTDKDGKAELALTSGGKVSFPDVTMSGDASGKGPKLPYVVRQGDFLGKLAFAYGFDAGEVWNDPKNAELKDKRKSPNLLHPGDVLYFSRGKRDGLDLKKGTTNQYQVKVPRTSVGLGFKDQDGPFANEPYVIEGLGAPQEGTSDGNGMVTIKVPLHVREVQITFTKRNVVYPVRVGDMDPIEEAMGARKRLQHLGYQGSPDADDDVSEAEAEARDRRSITAFQNDQGLPPTGELDDATKAALQKEHGS